MSVADDFSPQSPAFWRAHAETERFISGESGEIGIPENRSTCDEHMKSDWKQRFEQAAWAFHELKGLTKKVPASEWTPAYRELAELIHTLGREVFYVNP
jgi:hypothetical protein